MKKPDLKSAYLLKTDDDTKRLYASWAETYDEEFAAEYEFASPRTIAERFVAAGGVGPVLDFGCGTGLVGEHLARLGVGPVDGLDMTPEMLAVAGRKGVYADLIEGNILDGLELPEGKYAGVTSSGTFTHGHVGPEAIDALLRLAVPGAQFSLSINGEHYEAQGFAAKFEALAGRIAGFELPDVRHYGENAPKQYRENRGFVALFRKV